MVGLRWGLRRLDESVDVEQVTFTECCGLPLLVIDFHLDGGNLTMRYCKACESRRWLREGQPVKLSVIKECVGAMQPPTGPRAGSGRKGGLASRPQLQLASSQGA